MKRHERRLRRIPALYKLPLLLFMFLIAHGFTCFNLSILICVNPKRPPILGFSPRFGQNFHHAYLFNTFGDLVRNEEDPLSSPSLQILQSLELESRGFNMFIDFKE